MQLKTGQDGARKETAFPTSRSQQALERPQRFTLASFLDSDTASFGFFGERRRYHAIVLGRMSSVFAIPFSAFLTLALGSFELLLRGRSTVVPGFLPGYSRSISYRFGPLTRASLCDPNRLKSSI